MLVRMAAHQDITVELSLHGSQGLHVTPGDHLMTVDDSDLEVVNLDDFCLGEALHLITVTAHNMCLTLRCCEVLEPLNRLMENKARVNERASCNQIFWLGVLWAVPKVTVAFPLCFALL